MRREEGFTLLEALIAMVISAMVVIMLVGALFTFSRQGPKTSDELVAFRELQDVTRWINRDAAQAQSFSAGANPTYGTFSWPAYSSYPVVTYSVVYYYSGSDLMREERSNATPVASRAVAQNVANYSDVMFDYDSVNRRLTATVTLTVQPSFGADILTRTITTLVSLRPQFQVAAPSPGVVATPTPLPAQITYYCGANPTVLEGSYDSGSCANTYADDTSYYVVSSSGGVTKYASWEVQSQVITVTTVTAANVIFVGRVNTASVRQELYIYGSGGYPLGPDDAITYGAQDTDQTTTFPLEQAQLDYLNSLTGTNKKIRLKMRSYHNLPFKHSTDQLVFNVPGQ